MTVAQPASLMEVTIRGVGSNTIITGADPSCTIHLDGVYLGRPATSLMNFLDVERVEVLEARRERSTGATRSAARLTSSRVSRPTRWRPAPG